MRVPEVLTRDPGSVGVPIGTGGRYAKALLASPPLEPAASAVETPPVAATVVPSATASLDAVVSAAPGRDVEIPPLVPPVPARERQVPLMPRVALAKSSLPPIQQDSRTEEQIVLEVLREYARAYEHLDVRATKVVYPTVDDRALRRAFANIEDQRVSLTKCDVSISSSGEGAAARCSGKATYRTKVGSRVFHLTDRQWMFDLSRGGSGWQILNARIQ